MQVVVEAMRENCLLSVFERDSDDVFQGLAPSKSLRGVLFNPHSTSGVPFSQNANARPSNIILRLLKLL
jgi:hypothetical protein